MKELKKAVQSLYIKSNTNSWLKENTGYSKKREDGMTVYTFEPDTYKLISVIVDEFEDVFIDEDTYEDLEDGIDNYKKYIKKIKFELSLGVKKGQLVQVTLETDSLCYEIKFERIGTTGIDTDALDEVLELALSNQGNNW